MNSHISTVLNRNLVRTGIDMPLKQISLNSIQMELGRSILFKQEVGTCRDEYGLFCWQKHGAGGGNED